MGVSELGITRDLPVMPFFIDFLGERERNGDCSVKGVKQATSMRSSHRY
jgi:hypothetical protein